MGKPLKIMLLTLATAILMTSALAITESKVTQPPQQPIAIEYKTNFSNTGIEIDDNPQIKWTNTDTRASYKGHFEFTIHSNKRTLYNTDVTFSYQGSLVLGKQSGDDLVFSLPSYTFLQGKSGIINVIVTYHTIGDYKWNVAVISEK